MSANRSRHLSEYLAVFLVVSGFALLFCLVDVAEVFGPFVMWLASLPLCLCFLLGFQLIRAKGVKSAIVGWFAYIILTIIPFIPFMPLTYQIVTISLLLAVTIFGLYTYRKNRLRSPKNMARATAFI